MQAKPGCQSKCGNVTIPYPFGIGKDCSMIGTEGNGDAHITYNIICDHSHDPPKPFMNATDYFEILSISEKEVRIRNSFTEFNGRPFKSPVEPDDLKFRSSFNKSGLHYLDLSNTPFMTDVPRDFESIGVAVLETATKSTQSFTSFVMLAEEGQYRFDSSDLTLDATQISRKYEDKVIPVVVDWAIGYKTCGDAKSNLTSYACQHSNTNCTDDVKNGGYRCVCHAGHEGNPYLSPGCKGMFIISFLCSH
ncbi:hypothetical protein MKW92_028732 [Papaver armeniacum]|nr:hypothetical protein MKW92_028732 [Papaver armeniacum]